MKKTEALRALAGCAVVLLIAFAPIRATAAEGPHAAAIQKALDASSFSGDDRATITGKAAAAIGAGVPAEDVEIIVTRAIRRGADAAAIGRFLEISTSTKQEGLPVRPVTDRIEQGLAKAVPQERITVATEQLARKLGDARPVVDGLIRDGLRPQRNTSRDDAIASTARAFERTIPRSDVEAVGTAVRDRKGSLSLYTHAIDTAAYFAGSGMTPATAAGLVREAVSKGYAGQDLDSLTRRFEAEMRQGTGAEAAAKNLRRGMQARGSMEREEMREEMPGGPGMGGVGGMGGSGGMGGMGSNGSMGGMGGGRK